MDGLSSLDEWHLCGVEERGTDDLVSGVVEVSVWVNNGVIGVGAGSSGLVSATVEQRRTIRVQTALEQRKTTVVRTVTEQRETSRQRRADGIHSAAEQQRMTEQRRTTEVRSAN